MLSADKIRDTKYYRMKSLVITDGMKSDCEKKSIALEEMLSCLSCHSANMSTTKDCQKVKIPR